MGMGYIGLPTAALIAGKGIHVHGVDVNEKIVNTINKGKIHIVEPDLDGLVHHAVKQGFLVADASPRKADVFLIAVPTPFKNNFEPDLSYVEAAARMVLPFLEEGNLFVIESTSPIGTTEKIAALLFKERPELKNKISIAYCPERVLPGNVIYELENNDRVIGGIDEQSSDAAIQFYSRLVKGSLHKTNSRTAEMCKLVENAYRDVNIAFANELSMICDKAGINVNELIALASRHARVKILKPGPGVGGHCIAVDPWFIVSDFEKEARLIRQARIINNDKKDWVMGKIADAAKDFEKQHKRKAIVACMGLTYKPDIDDIRESPAMEIFSSIHKKQGNTLAVDPNIASLPGVELAESSKAIMDADIIVFLVAHKEFRTLQVAAGKIILDFCGVTSQNG